MGKKNKTKSRHQNRALNAFELAEAEESRNKRQYDESDQGSDDDQNPTFDHNSDNVVKAEDDEEINSDEAFGSSDEGEILDSSSWRKKRKEWKKKTTNDKKKKRSNDDSDESNSDDMDLDEDEEDDGYSSIDESELLPLSAVWDLDDQDLANTQAGDNDADEKPQSKSAKKVNNEILLNDDDDDSESSEEDSEEESDGSENSGDSEDDSDLELSDDDFDEVDEEKLSSLRAMISDVSNTDVVTFENAEKAKRQKLVQISNVTEGEFAVPGVSVGLSLEDLANSINDTGAKSSLTLLKDSDKSTAPLAVPLPKRLQERLDRKAAYDITKKEISKWKDTVNANRNAETLQFPINPGPEFVKPSSFATLEPETSLEKKVNQILEQSALADDKAEATFEQLAPSKLSMAELRKRRNELRMMRELMFREEQKAKRIKKIKSKTYRKIHRKEREREREMVEGSESDEEDHEAKRAEERMSLRHKNTGKWAKSMVKQGFTKDKATRAEMEEMLRRGEKLRSKIHGANDDDEEVYSNDDEEFINEKSQSEDDEEVQRIKERAGKGVLAMKFMRDAEAAERKRNQLAKEELQRARLGLDQDTPDESKGANEVVNEGRRVYAPGSKSARTELEEVMDQVRDELDEDEAKSLENKLKRKRNTLLENEREINSVRVENVEEESATKKKSDDFAMFDSEEDVQTFSDSGDEENPWLTADSGSSKRQKKSVTVLGRDSSAYDKSQDKLRKQQDRSRSGKKKAADAQDGIIDMNQTLKVVDPYGSDGEDNDDEDDKANNRQLRFKQTDLVKRAFANDDVVQEFELEKQQEIAEDGDKEVDVTLPGWGSWGGSDIAPKKRFIKKVKGVVNEKNRKDFKLDKVIISEKVNKKTAAVYNAKSVPFPFETREQYERSLRMPIGQEWSTRESHQNLIKPRVIIKPGLVIDPIKAPFKDDDEE
jgi:U3 small nucleolar RNA-associated protein 14